MQGHPAIIRALSSAEIYSELVAGEGWTPAEYEAWLAGVMAEVLLLPTQRDAVTLAERKQPTCLGGPP